MAGTSQGASDRVTNAVLLSRMDDVCRRLGVIEGKLDFVTENKTKIETLDDRLDKMESKSTRIDIILAASTIIGSIIGTIFGSRPA
jgi:hypothetical protein